MTKKATIVLTERQLWLLMNGFDKSYESDENDPEAVELSEISKILATAHRKVTRK